MKLTFNPTRLSELPAACCWWLVIIGASFSSADWLHSCRPHHRASVQGLLLEYHYYTAYHIIFCSCVIVYLLVYKNDTIIIQDRGISP